MPDATATVQSLRDRVAAFVRERDWEKYHNPKDLAISLNIEASELLELFQWREPREVDLRDPAFREAMEDELADVFIYCLSLANAIGSDLSDVTVRKLVKNERKYPAGEWRGRAR
ncbi:MAG: nucleotide pyrophosphohydrolase [Methanobacteriota archaeon]|nr:MAG: nucleotide pyrophosphohydrolase [Euryarchaeota archaeon]